MNRDQILLKFMLALVSNPNIHTKDDVKFDRYEEHYADITFEAKRLTDQFINAAADFTV